MIATHPDSISSDSTVWMIILGLSDTVADIDEAILWVRFWRAWTSVAPPPADENSAGEMLDFAKFTKAAWLCVLSMNNQFKQLRKEG